MLEEKNMKFSVKHLFFVLLTSNIRIASANILLLPSEIDLNVANHSPLLSKDEIKILRISTSHFPPYMYKNDKGHFYSGLELKLVQMIAETLNVSLLFQTTSKRSDLCSSVVLKTSDMCIGGIFPNENISLHTSMSAVYASDDLTWCVQKAEFMPLLISQMHFLKPEPWLLIIFGYGYTSGILLYLLMQFDLQYKQRNIRDWHYTTLLVALPACIGMSPSFRPVNSSTRIFFAFMLISAFFFFQITFTRTNSFLFNRIQWNQVSSFEDLIENDFRLVGSQEVFNILSRSKMLSNQQLDSFHICDDISDCLAELAHDNKLAIGGSRQNILSSPFYSPSNFVCFNDLKNIVSYPIALFMQKDLHLKEKVNGIIAQLLYAGFFEKWSFKSGKGEMPDPTLLPLSVSHISLATILFGGVGLLLSILTFVVENYVFRKMKQRIKYKIWMYLEQFFDGRRHYFKNITERLHAQNRHSAADFPYLE